MGLDVHQDAQVDYLGRLTHLKQTAGIIPVIQILAKADPISCRARIEPSISSVPTVGPPLMTLTNFTSISQRRGNRLQLI